jgi:hypothetical protein
MLPLSIPENFYAVVDAKTKVVLPHIIYCMGICITASDGRKVIAHYSDLPGYPYKDLNGVVHPLPSNHLASRKFSSAIFDFLLKELNISSVEIKEVTIFGRYKKRTDVFKTKEYVDVSDQSVRDFVSSRLDIAPEQVHLNPVRKVHYGVSPEGRIIILPVMEDLIEEIERENIRFHKQSQTTPFSRTTLLANHGLFLARAQKTYAKDSEALYDIDNQALIF